MGAKILETYTYDDYKNWEGDWELIYGQPVPWNSEKNMSPSPFFSHQQLGGNFIFELKLNIDNCPNCEVVYETDWVLDDTNTLCPDVVLICNRDKSKNYIIDRPEIVIEISSKSTKKKDETFKLNLYEEEKVPYYILAYPKEKKLKILEFNKKKNSYKSLGYYKDGKFTLKNLKCKDITLNIEKIFKNI